MSCFVKHTPFVLSALKTRGSLQSTAWKSLACKYSSEASSDSAISKTFAMFERVETVQDQQLSASSSDTDVPFATLLRHSKLMQLGDPDGQVVIGNVSEIVGDDLYVDFGGKFSCVCKQPRGKTRLAVLC